MNERPVRVRFAPSPTGGLHLGGMRTILYNYLFAKKNKGTFVVRIEDTDRTRYVAAAEEYIFECLAWAGLIPDESVVHGGPYAPYRQSERKELYAQYALQLVASGHAYYAFDTPEELEQMRETQRTPDNPSPQYDKKTRMGMRNSLSMSEEELEKMLQSQAPYVIRIKVPADETVLFTDMIRGPISYDTNLVDDKVLLKADGMPTYHLAVVVDDFLMKISHAFRGEEWLPSAPIHILLWEYLGWKQDMPNWVHLPLILKPDGNGKLSKRDGERLGFPIFAMDWTDANSGELTQGFKERGFLPAAFINTLAMLGWNDGTEQELFSLEELCSKFELDRVHKAGAKFDYEKAKWYNHQYIMGMDLQQLSTLVHPILLKADIACTVAELEPVVGMVRERCVLLTDFVPQAGFFFKAPDTIDTESLKPKWNAEIEAFFQHYAAQLEDNSEQQNVLQLEESFAKMAAEHSLKKGAVMLPLRVMLVGGKYGPGVFDILHFIGRNEAAQRIKSALAAMKA